MKKIIMIILLIVLLVPMSVVAADLELNEKARSSVIIEAKTGSIIYDKNMNDRYPPASMTKMMSMLLIVNDIENGGLSLDEEITVSKHAASMGGSQIWLEQGEVMTVEDLLKAVAIGSANDATVALAERVAGTEEAFVNMMNDMCLELGLENTHFDNATGLPSENQYSSAYDMAMIAKELVKHELIISFTSVFETYLREGTADSVWLVNTNRLVRFYEGVDGLKTGHTEEAGYCLTATANIDNMRVISVVMGEPTPDDRLEETRRNLDYAYQQYELETIVPKGMVLENAMVEKGDVREVEIIPMDDLVYLKKRGEFEKEIEYVIERETLVAPLIYGDVVGHIIVKENNKNIIKVPLTVKSDVKKANILELYIQHLSDTLSFSK